ncbi:hypothetical protein B9Z55_007360 [Caenorhabditis nigoni]|nr:hypothetical protein B9Z55_007360 [Caenorhabditis nigoni]
MSKIIMKEEVESDESSMDSFEEFPAGAQRYCRMALRARQAAREMGLQVDRDGIHVQSGVDVPEDWTMFLAPPAMVFPKLEAEAPSDDRSTALPEAQDTQEIFEKSVLPTIRQFMSDTNSVGSTLTTTWSKDGNRSEIKIVVERSPMKEAVRMEESQGSEVFTSPRRRLRVVIESDEEEEEQKEEEARTPKKKAKKAKEDPRTPSTRLRSMNLRESSSEPEETQETQDEDIGDSQADPDYVPDTQEERGSYWDNRIPKDAPKDPLDLDY